MLRRGHIDRESALLPDYGIVANLVKLVKPHITIITHLMVRDDFAALESYKARIEGSVRDLIEGTPPEEIREDF